MYKQKINPLIRKITYFQKGHQVIKDLEKITLVSQIFSEKTITKRIMYPNYAEQNIVIVYVSLD